MDVAHAQNAEIPIQNSSSPFFVLKLRLHDVVIKVQLSVSAIWAFLVKLVHLDFDIEHVATVILEPILGPFNRTRVRIYKYCKRNGPVWKKNVADKKRCVDLCWRKLTICWKKFARWFWNTFTVGNTLDVVGKLLDFPKIWKPMPGILLSRMKYQYVDEVLRPGYVRVKFRWREQNWRRRLGMSPDMTDPWQLVKKPYLIADFKFEADGSLDLRKVAECYMVDKLEVLSPGHLEAYPLGGVTHISSVGVYTLTVRDGFITVVEHEDNLTRARKVFHQWVRGSMIYCLVRWIVLLSVVGATLGAVGHLAYNVDMLFASLIIPIVFVYIQFYALHMSTKYGFDWTPWPARRARGWVGPKYQRYL